MPEVVTRFLEELDKLNWKYEPAKTLENGDILISSGVAAKILRYRLLFLFREGGRSFSVIASELARVPDEKHYELLEQINRLNGRYSFVKVLLSEQNDIVVRGDAILAGDGGAQQALALFQVTLKIVDEIIPVILRAICGEA